MTNRRRLAGAAVGLVVALLVSGCTGEDPATAPTSSPTPSPATSPSASTSSAAPQAESAEDFIRRWVEVNARMQNTGDTKEFLAMSRGCDPCASVAARVKGIYRAGGFVKTDGWSVVRVRERTSSGRALAIVVEIDSSPTRYSESAQAAEENLPGGQLVERFDIQRDGQTWRMSNFSEVAQ